MKRNYQLIVYTYIAMQLFSGFGVQLTAAILQGFGIADENLKLTALAVWLVFSFGATLIIILLLLRDEFYLRDKFATSLPKSLLWAIFGVFLALFAQAIAAQIEYLFGVRPGSENTQNILELINKAPIIIIVSSVVGPILEEIVFRKIIFGTLYKYFNFFVSALVSALLFSVAHLELEHTLLYAAIGFTFAFLYVKTKRIIVPILTHILMNTYVVIIQLSYHDQQAESIHFIGGFLIHILNNLFSN
ncbi:CPBP family intramembrane metalloprotease [Caldibacillus lycopersici]|uniref:CPBP family intramembrane metalloprotease n=1 Tax=Perspicuibacillus lycopersici TaxID=1325689 RepID=A0AAE3IVG3_9BACI|nr:type II CAAX endopeptidase family protein [Perspicuibacillus lycopersici]MCU9615323.1 CPBP family intramembrane metalloprotease [Perspicuibacillus lycopersici]